MQVGSRVLVTLRHSLAHFDQIRIVWGLIMINPEWKWFLKRQIQGDFWKENFFICKYEIILGTHLRVVDVVLIASEDV
jgi:hypothetical protein